MVASETVSDLVMKIAEPVFKGQADEIEVTRQAELEYRDLIDEALKETVWSNSFCTSVSLLY